MNNFEPPIGLHNKLNPKLWKGKDLHPEVQYALLRIAKEFFDWMDIDTKIVDVVISGSQANYNYSKHSDIDLHLIIPMDDIQCDEPIDELFDTKRRLWKEKHNITIRGIPVELYAENSNKPAVSSSYSLIKDQWIDEPDAPVMNYNEEEVRQGVVKWTKVIKHSIAAGNLEELKKLTQLLMNYRKVGLAVSGEFGVPNLVYKSLRNSTILAQLHDAINNLKDKNLSLR